VGKKLGRVIGEKNNAQFDIKGVQMMKAVVTNV
jgi:hypothetical protein